MARKRQPERDKALEIFISKKGKISPRDIADQLGIEASKVRKWKCTDKWEDKLPKRKRGGQPGNKNAKGNSGGGAPVGNTNAETHGAFTIPRVENWDADRRAEIEALTLDFERNALDQYRQLRAKELDLECRIAQLSHEPEDTLHFDRLMTMEMPDGGEMKYRSESTAFSRRMQLEAELNRVHGRILKLLDSFKSVEMERQRIQLERERLQFSKQKAMGIFDAESGEEAPEDFTEEFEIVE